MADRFAVTVVTRSVDNNNTTVGHLIKRIQPLTLAFHSWRRNECRRRRRSPLIQGGLKIRCYVTFYAKKLTVQARDIISGENKTENLLVQMIKMVIHCNAIMFGV